MRHVVGNLQFDKCTIYVGNTGLRKTSAMYFIWIIVTHIFHRQEQSQTGKENIWKEKVTKGDLRETK